MKRVLVTPCLCVLAWTGIHSVGLVHFRSLIVLCTITHFPRKQKVKKARIGFVLFGDRVRVLLGEVTT